MEVAENPLRRFSGRFSQRGEVFIAQVGSNCPQVADREIDERCFGFKDGCGPCWMGLMEFSYIA